MSNPIKFLMDYDNIPGKGPLMLFRENGDGTRSLATVEDVEKAVQEAMEPLVEALEFMARYFRGNVGFGEKDPIQAVDEALTDHRAKYGVKK